MSYLAHQARSRLLKLAFLGFAVPIALANLSATPQPNPPASPTVSQSATPKPVPLAEPKQPETSTAVEDKQQSRDEKTQGWPPEWMVAIAGSAIATYLLVLWLRPRWLLLIPSSFKTPKIGPIPELSPGFIHFFQYRPRVLDAWVSDRIEKAREEFDRRKTVEERKIHISMPVVLDGNMVTGLTAKELGQTCAKQELRLLICGEGGAGKTHLACQIAKWAMAEEKDERLCSHRMLPVLIEEELEEPKENSTIKAPLLDAIARQLKNLRDEEKPIPEELLKRLLEKRRVLVIVDHLSEMCEATRKLIRWRDSSFPVNALVVTSRLQDILGKEMTHMLLQPMRVNGKQLSIFMDDYLKAKGKRDLFEDDQYFEYLRRLSLIVTDAREITLLFAKLYADQMIAVAEGQITDDLPKNVPDLMLSYVNELNRNVQEGKLDDATVQQALKLIAWNCVQLTFKPETADRQEVLAHLAAQSGEGAATEKAIQQLKYLEERLFIIRTMKPAHQRLRISLDPLTEYLAGLYLVEQYRNDEEAWRKFLADAAEKPGTLEEIQGFLLAVRECCLVRVTETKVPDFVAEELGQLAGLDLAALEQERLNRRIRYLIADLSRPDAGDRVHAIEEVGKIGPAAKYAAIPIAKLLRDSDYVVRRNAAEALGKLGNTSEAVVQELLAQLRHKEEDAYVRCNAACALGELGNASEAVLQELCIRLQDKEDDVDVCRNVVQALVKLDNASEYVVHELLNRLQDKEDDVEVRCDVVEALVKLNDVSETMVQELLNRLHDKKDDFAVRGLAAWALGELSNASESVTQELLARLCDKEDSAYVRRDSAWALVKLRNVSEPVVQELLARLHDRDDDAYVRRDAASALVESGNVSEPVVQELLNRLKDEDEDSGVYLIAIKALSNLGKLSESVLQELLSKLNDGNEDCEVRFRVAEALIKFGYTSQHVIFALEILSRNEDPYYQREAKKLLDRIAQQKSQKQAD